MKLNITSVEKIKKNTKKSFNFFTYTNGPYVRENKMKIICPVFFGGSKTQNPITSTYHETMVTRSQERYSRNKFHLLSRKKIIIVFDVLKSNQNRSFFPLHVQKSL